VNTPDEAVSPPEEAVTDTVQADLDLRVPPRRPPVRGRAEILAVVALGGALGALSRYGIGLWLPTEPGRFPWGTFLINVSGCALIGILMVLVTEGRLAHPLARPFLGVGVLGGFTTFSTYSNEIRGLLRPGDLPVAVAYLLGTLACALLALIVASWLTRAALRLGRSA
jgi:fluoride exporter